MSDESNRMLIGISGAVAVTNIFDYLIHFGNYFADEINVIMTRSADEIISTKIIEKFINGNVFLSDWDHPKQAKMPHIELPGNADVFIIMPASYNMIGKVANGIADDLLSTAAAAYSKPLFIAPSMNELMWDNKALKRNIDLLKEYGHHIIEPAMGREIATGREVVGGMPDPHTILDFIRDKI